MPASVTLEMRSGGSYFGYLCQRLFIGQGVGYELGAWSSPNPPCPGGAPYLVFRFDGASAYEVEAGEILEASGMTSGPVSIETTSVGSVTQDDFSGADQVDGITDMTSVVITTLDHEVTFAFDGLDLTITEFDAL